MTIVVPAPNPSTGTIDEQNRIITYTGGPVSGSGNSPCPDTAPETFILTTKLPDDFGTDVYEIAVTLAPTPSADLILTVRDGSGAVISSKDDGFVNATEATTIAGQPGTSQYRVQVCPFAGSAPSYSVRIELSIVEGGGGGGGATPAPCNGDVFGGPDRTCPGVPRYQLFVPPNTASYTKPASGEANIGFNSRTQRIMAANNVPIARVTPAEIKADGSGGASGMPEACPELWENKTNTTGTTTLDPILWTDQKSRRTISSNQTTGTNGAYAYTDNDGDTWIEIGIGPPSGGVDHQTVGSGPLPASLSQLTTPQNQGQYVLYCTQNLVGSVCQRSLTLGTSWENGQIATGPGTSNSQGCGGLHGHVKVAPDGSAWMPDESCGARQGGGISLNASATPWSEFSVRGTDDRTGQPFDTRLPSTGTSDPSIAFDDENTVYYCYINGDAGGSEGHPHMAVGRRTPGTANVTWLRDTDLGLSHGIVNAVFPQAWGGSPGRAACGFLATQKPGSYQTTTFTGDWYLYIATTYDQGRTWVTVNATPDDPVQHDEGVCTMGSGCSGSTSDRNLLDFNEATADDEGRFLFAYSDGCVTPGCVARTAGHDGTAELRIARQIGGKTLSAAFDSQTDTNDGLDANGPINPRPVAPKRPCLLDATLRHPTASARDATTARLFWRAPDNGGAPIVSYDIYRSTTPSDPNPVKIATTADAKPQYDDTTAGSEPFLYYRVRATTSLPQTSDFSNEIALQVGAASVSPCELPGVLVVNDLTGSGGDDDAGQNTPPRPSVNVKSMSLAEPYLGEGVNQLVFTLQVGPDIAAAPSSEWYIIWNRKTIAADGSDRAYVAMVTNAAGTTRFEYGNFGPPLSPTAPVPNANTPTPLGLATGGGYNVATGVITISLPTALAENAMPGESLTAMNVRTFAGRYSGDPSAPRGQKSQNNASDITGSGNYTLVGNASCAPNSEPLADLTAFPASGRAPLAVAFDAAGSSDPDSGDSVTAYSFDFGDGSFPATVDTPAVTHVYESAGRYTARVTVTDSQGLASSNAATVTIDVTGPQVPAENNRLGGSLAGLSLVVLGLLALRRRCRG